MAIKEVSESTYSNNYEALSDKIVNIFKGSVSKTLHIDLSEFDSYLSGVLEFITSLMNLKSSLPSFNRYIALKILLIFGYISAEKNENEYIWRQEWIDTLEQFYTDEDSNLRKLSLSVNTSLVLESVKSDISTFETLRDMNPLSSARRNIFNKRSPGRLRSRSRSPRRLRSRSPRRLRSRSPPRHLFGGPGMYFGDEPEVPNPWDL